MYWEDGAAIGFGVHGTIFYTDVYGKVHRSKFHFLRECAAGSEDDPNNFDSAELPTLGNQTLLFEIAPEEYQPAAKNAG